MLRRPIALLAACLIANPALAQTAAPAAPPAATGNQAASTFDSAQLDALLAPIALYPDPLLTQVLMAVTFPLQIVEASRWLEDPAHKSLTGQALTDALNKESWDPSVKSLVPFPQVLAQLNGNLDWVQQLGYAMTEQQKDVMDAVQRLRRQAQDQGHLKSSPQQVVRSEPQPSGPPAVVIEPAQPDVVYVPSYDPAVVYGTWPYASYPPVVLPPPPGYAVGTALATGLAFGAGVAITSSLWGWASPNWGHGDVNVNVNRWNNINVNRAQIHSGAWNSAVNRPGGRAPYVRPPAAGPVGRPVHGNGLAANAIGRPSVHVPASAVNRAAIKAPSAGQHPNLKPGTRPNPPRANAGNHPNIPNRPNVPAHRPNTAANAGRHPSVPANRQFQHPAQGGGAFAGLDEGNRASQFQQRGFQSRQFHQAGGGFQRPAGGFQRPAGGGFHGGGGGFHGGGFHGRR